jgi:hypothetical protein
MIWYLVTVFHYFDPSPRIWINSLGISAVIGFALLLSVNNTQSWRNQGWQTFRLFLMPFCVSSFSSLIKGRDFFLIIPPKPSERFIAVGLCAVFVAAVLTIKRLYRSA